MSDEALKLVRDKLRNVTLFIVDEISMVSSVTLMYLEIFQTEEVEDSWFGSRNLLFLVIFCNSPQYLKAQSTVLFLLNSLPNLLDV